MVRATEFKSIKPGTLSEFVHSVLLQCTKSSCINSSLPERFSEKVEMTFECIGLPLSNVAI